MEDQSTQPEATPVVAFKKRGAKAKANIRKRAATPPPADSNSDDYVSTEDETERKVKKRKTNTGALTASSKTHEQLSERDHSATVFTADRSTLLANSENASRVYEEDGIDGPSSKSLLGTTRAMPMEGQGSNGVYKGLANQTKFIQKNPNAPQRTVGPVKAPTNIRTITVTDYSPDVCKDYKQTGFCGFGDGCKFLHAREDFKAGWQLDKEWETVTKGNKNIGGTIVASADRSKADDDEDDEDELLDSIPFSCPICQDEYRAPVITRCGHYFCEPCALKRYRKDPACAACGAGTNGVFNSAKRLEKLLAKKRERVAARRQLDIDRDSDSD